MSINTGRSSVFLASLSRFARADDKTSLSTWSTVLTSRVSYAL
jgi:hypothetical protein